MMPNNMKNHLVQTVNSWQHHFWKVTVCFDGLALAKFSAQVPYIITEKLLLDKASMFYINRNYEENSPKADSINEIMTLKLL